MFACCGLDCAKCEAYLATQADSWEQRVEVARKWSDLYKVKIRPEQVECEGCTAEGKKFFYCENLCEIRKCCRSRGLAHCGACSDYMCGTLSEFVKIAPEAGAALERLRG